MQVRHAVVDDADAVGQVHVRAWQVAYDGMVPADLLAGLDPAVRAERVRARLRESDRETATLVAVDGGEVVGFADIGPANGEPEAGQVYAIYVHPDRWGAGAGRALMDAALAHLRAAGHRPVRLWVLDTNVRARRFYERCGFVLDGAAQTEEFGGAPLSEVRYTHPLG
jgi:ribosomal protein S18 acetylase RimI-like enzyme